MIRKKVICHLTENKLISDCQQGFISVHSCTRNLPAVLDAWTEALSMDVNVDAMYLDIPKAPDSVSHQHLTNKLHGFSIQGKVLDWVSQFLTTRRQCVTASASVSKWARVSSRILQGSILGLALFTVNINDLPSMMHTCALMFANNRKFSHHLTTLRGR